ncbi:MAG: RNA polymerase sigma-70 factor [Bacteroidota bacterium]
MVFREDKYWKEYERDPAIAFKHLYDSCHQQIYGFCVNNGQSREEAIEIVQEAFFKFWQKRAGLKRKQDVRAYLFKIARNLIVDHYRQVVREKAASEYHYYFLPNLNDTDNKIAYNELIREIEKTFEKMPSIQKLVFQLSRLKGYSNKEIAEELGISIKTVEEHIRKSIKTFKKELNETVAICSSCFLIIL